MDITFCTFFFDIGRGQWDSFTLANNTYMYWFKNFLSLNVNLYIETEEKFVDIIKENRKAIDPDFKKTVIVTKQLSELPAYNKFNAKLEKLMFSDAFKAKVHHQVPEMNQPLYNVLMFNKLSTMQNAVKLNPFNTQYYSWVDTGFIRDSKWVEDNSNWPDLSQLQLKPNNIRVFCIDSNISPKLKEKEYKEFHCMSQIRHIKGTIFFLDKRCLDWFAETFDDRVNYCIKNGFIGSDEKIFDLCYTVDSSKFDIVQCDWRQEFHLYAHKKEKEYVLDIKWDINDISKAKDYAFWYIGIEDITTAVIYRHDLNPIDHPQYISFKENVLSVKFSSYTQPHRVVIWPVDKNNNWLTRIVYPLC